MRKEVKGTVVEKLSDYLAQYPHFYLADIEALDAVKTAELRAVCNKENVKLVVVKNTLMRKALADSETDFAELYGALKGNTCVMFTQNANAPARIIKELIKNSVSPLSRLLMHKKASTLVLRTSKLLFLSRAKKSSWQKWLPSCSRLLRT